MKVSIVGASGYGGGELLRLLLDHPDAEVHQVTSERNAGKPVTRVHPNLRRRTSLDFCTIRDLEKVDLLFVSLPHTQSMQRFLDLSGLAEKVIDLSADFRLKEPAVYPSPFATAPRSRIKARTNVIVLRSASSRSPHQSMPSQIRARMDGACSPMPPPKITASAPPSAAK